MAILEAFKTLPGFQNTLEKVQNKEDCLPYYDYKKLEFQIFNKDEEDAEAGINICCSLPEENDIDTILKVRILENGDIIESVILWSPYGNKIKAIKKEIGFSKTIGNKVFQLNNVVSSQNVPAQIRHLLDIPVEAIEYHEAMGAELKFQIQNHENLAQAA